MKHDRLHALTDGIFAIVMTILVFGLRVPTLKVVNNQNLLSELSKESKIFVSYLISFMLLFTYWRGHNFIVSTVAKNLDMNLVNLNMLFLLLIGLVPFSSQLVGTYPDTQVGLIIYALNIIFIGLTLFAMRLYIDKSPSIENEERQRHQNINARIRVLTPVSCSILAIAACFINTWLAFSLLLLGVIFNLYNNAADTTRKLLKIR
ncbi:MAG TPA: TMEM175 family protein [Patescibacteria group bacterium]|nr:TMEM175 family protein [Patescibacteria group bacterium]